MEYFDLLRHRKSTRSFSAQPVSPEHLALILEAANSAPVGSNLYRDLHLTVVQNREVLDLLSEAALKRFQDKAKVKKLAGETRGVDLNARSFDPFYNAPAVIFISHRRQTLQPGIEFSNAACLACFMHLAAADLGLGSVFMWFALESMRELPELDHSAALNLPEDFEPLLGLALGHPEKPLAPKDLKADKLSVNFL